MKPLRFLPAALVLVLLALAVPAPALAGVKVEVAKHKSGPWSPFGLNVHIPTGDSKNLYIRIKNTSHHAHAKQVNLTERRSADGPDYQVSWFKGKRDISHDVQTSGHDFTLKHDRSKRFRLRVKALDGSDQECVSGEFAVDPGMFVVVGSFRANGNAPCLI
ncbi:MAG: hypothetical protein ABI726_02125 [bacterium]